MIRIGYVASKLINRITVCKEIDESACKLLTSELSGLQYESADDIDFVRSVVKQIRGGYLNPEDLEELLYFINEHPNRYYLYGCLVAAILEMCQNRTEWNPLQDNVRFELDRECLFMVSGYVSDAIEYEEDYQHFERQCRKLGKKKPTCKEDQIRLNKDIVHLLDYYFRRNVEGFDFDESIKKTDINISDINRLTSDVEKEITLMNGMYEEKFKSILDQPTKTTLDRKAKAIKLRELEMDLVSARIGATVSNMLDEKQYYKAPDGSMWIDEASYLESIQKRR